MEQLDSQLPAADATLPDDVLDRLDEIVAPGETITRSDVAFEPRAIRDVAARRRRP
jgi:aryl-alcohol dehydrogenase (NADP+)